MSDASATRSLRERLGGSAEDRLGRALSDLLDNPLLTGAVGRAFDAREKAAQAQEVAMGALNIPSATDIERLTRRLRSVSQRLERIEDSVHRLDRNLSSHGVETRLAAIEEQLETLTRLVAGKPKDRSPEPQARTAKASPRAAKSRAKSHAAEPHAAKPHEAAKPRVANGKTPRG